MQAPTPKNVSTSHPGFIGAAWGLLGVLTLLGFAIWRLSQYAFGAFSYDFALWHWGILCVALVFMLYFEGYKGFHQGFAPRVVKRAHFLHQHRAPFAAYLFAPLFLMGYIYATTKRRITSVVLTIMIISFILAFRLIAQPLRGILDFAVCAGLLWGIASILYFIYRLKQGSVPAIDDDIKLPKTFVANN